KTAVGDAAAGHNVYIEVPSATTWRASPTNRRATSSTITRGQRPLRCATRTGRCTTPCRSPGRMAGFTLDLATLPVNVAVNDAMERAASIKAELPRPYLGASIAGSDCLRRVQYDWWCTPLQLDGAGPEASHPGQYRGGNRASRRTASVVASLAERLERAEPEFVDVAAMCLDVITDLSRRYDAALEAERAEGVLAKLVSSDASPASRGVPLVPFRRFAANAHWLNLSSAGYHASRASKQCSSPKRTPRTSWRSATPSREASTSCRSRAWTRCSPAR